MILTPSSLFTRVGVRQFAVSPCPRAPCRPIPQVNTAPSCVTAAPWKPPAATCRPTAFHDVRSKPCLIMSSPVGLPATYLHVTGHTTASRSCSSASGFATHWLATGDFCAYSHSRLPAKSSTSHSKTTVHSTLCTVPQPKTVHAGSIPNTGHQARTLRTSTSIIAIVGISPCWREHTYASGKTNTSHQNS